VSHNQCFIAGIANSTGVSGGNVVVDATTGQLGIGSSSRRYKENITDIDTHSSDVLNLRPVTFNYKKDTHNRTQYGLIAEEVNELYPELVIKKDGQIESVHYQFLPILMLNEMKKQQQTIDELRTQVKGILNK
jgi:hypothetical protein